MSYYYAFVFGTPREPFNSTAMGVNSTSRVQPQPNGGRPFDFAWPADLSLAGIHSIPTAHLHVQCTPVRPPCDPHAGPWYV